MIVKIEGFNWHFAIYDKNQEIKNQWHQTNLIPDQGVSFLIRSPFGETPIIQNFYFGVFKGSFVPNKAVTAADIPNSIGEYTGYAEQNRPLWNKQFIEPSSYDNKKNLAALTFPESQTLNGAFLVSSNIKGSGNGTLLSILRFATPYTVQAGGKVELSCGFSYISGSIL